MGFIWYPRSVQEFQEFLHSPACAVIGYTVLLTFMYGSYLLLATARALIPKITKKCPQPFKDNRLHRRIREKQLLESAKAAKIKHKKKLRIQAKKQPVEPGMEALNVMLRKRHINKKDAKACGMDLDKLQELYDLCGEVIETKNIMGSA